MASNCARRILQQSSSSAKAFLNSGPRISLPSVASGPAKLGGLPSPASRLSRRRNLLSKSRVRMELACGESLMPLHSVTASALLKSMLSSEVWASGVVSLKEVLTRDVHAPLQGEFH